MTPLDIILMSMFAPILKHEGNEAKGEIVNMHFHDAAKSPIYQRVIGLTDGYDWIWVHLGRNYWKVISKVKESPWSCQ